MTEPAPRGRQPGRPTCEGITDGRQHLLDQRDRRLLHESIDDAIRGAVARAAKTLHNLDWFEVTDMRGRIEDGRCHFQVTLKVGFRLDERPS